MGPYIVLSEPLKIDENTLKKLERDYNKFGDSDMPENIEKYIMDEYQLDISANFAGYRIKNPFGKASGQLSMNLHQIENDVLSGLSFIVLKTVIAEDDTGKSTMKNWKINESAMKVEKIKSKSGLIGWTVTWKGRGWSKSFDEYIELYRKSLELSDKYGIPISASCLFHLPTQNEEFKLKEYEYSVSKLFKAYKSKKHVFDMILEIDFSPTLNVLASAKDLKNVKRWFSEIPKIVRRYSDSNIRLGAKVFNSTFGVKEQAEILKYALESDFDFLTLFNRLYDPIKNIAYGGYDLSDRNLTVMDETSDDICAFLKSKKYISATGNICNGKMMIEYALRGASSGQIHTFFQIPIKYYRMKNGLRPRRALHELIFNPSEGLIPSMYHLECSKFDEIAEARCKLNNEKNNGKCND